MGGSAPDSWSWVDQGAITSIKDQKQCGSCAAFAAVAAIDSCFYFASNNLFDDLSEQHLMDCANGHYSYDDEGAWGAFGYYGGGVYEDSRCCEADSDPNCIWTLNHEVTVIGYGHESGKDYWLVKNSWGDRWGDNGYIKIKRGSGHCGIGRQHVIQPYCAIN